jgi:hypothetical protein
LDTKLCDVACGFTKQNHLATLGSVPRCGFSGASNRGLFSSACRRLIFGLRDTAFRANERHYRQRFASTFVDRRKICCAAGPRRICIVVASHNRQYFDVTTRFGIDNGMVSRRFRTKRKGAAGPAPDDPTPGDNVLYLLSELEHAIERPTVTWSTQLAGDVQRRLENIAQAVRQIVARGP